MKIKIEDTEKMQTDESEKRNNKTNLQNDSENAKTGQKRRKWRAKKEKTSTNDEAYNSEDEYIRPRVVKTLDEQQLQYVDPNELAKSLSKKGLKIVYVGKDGNCLFRSVAHQLYGDQEMHDVVRKQCVEYMEKERDHFSQFVTEEFNEYIARKRRDTCYGNHLELQAIVELYNRPILIYATNEEPLNLFQEEYETDNPPMQLSYHYGNHYNSVFDPTKPTFGVGFGLPGLQPGAADKQIVQQAIQESEQQILNQDILEGTRVASEKEEIENKYLEAQLVADTEQQSALEVDDAQFLDAIKKESALEADGDLFLESQYMDLIEAQMIEDAKKASWFDY